MDLVVGPFGKLVIVPLGNNDACVPNSLLSNDFWFNKFDVGLFIAERPATMKKKPLKNW